MLQNYRLVWGLFNRRERRHFIILILLSILMALFEVAGVAAILPFLAMIGDPSIIETNPAVALFARISGFSDPKQITCLLYTSPSPRDLSTSRMPSSA